MPTILYPDEGALNKADVIKTALAGAKLHLFQEGLTLSRGTTLDQLNAVEADYDGYTAGGVTITAFLGPGISPDGGASLFSPTIVFAFASEEPTVSTNAIKGWYITLTGGELYNAGNLDAVKQMQVNGNIIPMTLEFVEGRVAGSTFDE